MAQTSNADDRYENAVRINGFGFKSQEEKTFEDLLKRNPDASLDINLKHEKEKIKKSADGFSVAPKVVTSLQEYIDVIDTLKQSRLNPVYYHGHTNANDYPLPSVLRTDPGREKSLFDEFRKKFPDELNKCTNNMERLLFMQHYGLATRCYDLSENPFIGLYLACAPMVKFRKEEGANQYKWGSIFLFNVTEEQKDDIKYWDSSTVSVIATTATLEKKFSLKHLQTMYRSDGHLAFNDNFIYFRDILRRSVLVRTKQDNPRIRNQRGLFIMFNANKISEIYDKGDPDIRHRISPKEFMDYVLSEKCNPELNIESLRQGECKDYPYEFKNTTEWDFRFEKIIPYSLENENPLMQNDPFDIKKFYYRDEDKNQIVVLVPPTAKKKILRQLENFGITEDFVYPEPDSVAYQLNNLIK